MRLRNIYEVFPNLPVDIDAATVSPADEMRYENREMLFLKGDKRVFLRNRKTRTAYSVANQSLVLCMGSREGQEGRGIGLLLVDREKS